MNSSNRPLTAEW